MYLGHRRSSSMRSSNTSFNLSRGKSLHHETAHRFETSGNRVAADLAADRAEQQAQQESGNHWLVDSHVFHIVVWFGIAGSVVQMGVEVDYPEFNQLWDILEYCFTALFLAEAVLKIYCLGWRYVLDVWNVLDGCLVLLSIIDVCLLGMLKGSLSVDLQMFSILRILRLVRVVRVLRLAHGCRKSFLLIKGVLQAFRAAARVGMLLGFVLYIGGIVVTTYFNNGSAELYPGYTTDMAEVDETSLMRGFNPHLCFGSLAASMLTLFHMALLVEWPEIVRPIFLREPWLVICFVLFSVFVTFGVINVIIGMIVETVLDNARQLDEEERQHDVKSKLAVLGSLEDLWTRLVNISDGVEVSADMLIASMEGDERWNELLARCRLPRGYGAPELFLMLDDDGSRELNYQEFVENFYRLIDCNGEFQHACIVQKGVNELKIGIRENTSRLERIEALLTGDEHPQQGTRVGAAAAAAAPATTDHTIPPTGPRSVPHPPEGAASSACHARQDGVPPFEAAVSKDAVLLEAQRAVQFGDALERLSQIVRSLLVDSPGPRGREQSPEQTRLASSSPSASSTASMDGVDRKTPPQPDNFAGIAANHHPAYLASRKTEGNRSQEGIESSEAAALTEGADILDDQQDASVQHCLSNTTAALLAKRSL